MRNVFDVIKTVISLGGGIFRCISKPNGLSYLSALNYSNHIRFQNDGNSVFDYNLVMSLPEKDYPIYLSQAYYIKTGQKLNLKNPKTINEKIQWLKIYDNIPIKTTLTDKILVRDWIKSKIGEKYLKNVLWIGKNFEDIPFEELPNSFVIKANHGCKWHFIIKNKKDVISTSRLYQIAKIAMENWILQSFFGWSDFETQYKNIKSQILIEDLYRQTDSCESIEYEIWCFNGQPKIFQKIIRNEKYPRKVSTYNEYFENIDLAFQQGDIVENNKYDENILKAAALSKILAKDFKLVRVDWMLFQDKLYFEEMTFTPFSGFISFDGKYSQWQLQLGNMLNLKGV